MSKQKEMFWQVSDSPWIVALYYSFQDSTTCILIMEFLPGGDLMTMLIRWKYLLKISQDSI